MGTYYAPGTMSNIFTCFCSSNLQINTIPHFMDEKTEAQKELLN